MKDLVKVIQEESYTYRDPITSFIEDLYVNFDFNGAQQKLRECETVLVNDFFLVACLDDFIENSRLMIFETFCRIHQCISITMLAEKLNMGTGTSTYFVNVQYLVNLISKIGFHPKKYYLALNSPPIDPISLTKLQRKEVCLNSPMFFLLRNITSCI